MAETAFQVKYRNETIAGFEKSESLVRKTVVKEFVKEGGSAVFLVADSGGATAVTRGPNGDIPTRPDSLTQTTATLVEWHDIPEKTRFNIFAGQGDQRALMQRTSQAVINRKIDTDINTELATASVTWGSAAVATLALVSTAKTKLANAFAAGGSDEVFAQITPAYHAYLMGINEFSSADFINTKPFDGVSKDDAFKWWGVNWIVNPALAGAGTSSATCFMYNKNAIGHACDMDTMDTHVGYDEKNDKSWCRASVFMGSALLQNAGVVKMLHDDSAYS